jgi:3-phosphoshikimate 1-carboxyvinyltransferase
MSSNGGRRFIIEPGGTLSGTFHVPGDKSISHRAVMLGALADGVTEVSGFLEGDDALATLAAMRALGVVIEGPDRGALRVHGVGRYGLRQPSAPLDLGNSGTSMRLFSGLLAGQSFASELVGDRSLMGRPMRRVTGPLGQMGARIHTEADGTAPLRIAPVTALQGIDYALPVASAQVKSALLLAGLYARGETRIHEPAVTRDHTERMLTAFGADLTVADGEVRVTADRPLRAGPVIVPGDISSAAFFLVGASIATGGAVRVKNVGLNPTRTGVIHILRRMGARIHVDSEHTDAGEPVGTVTVEPAALQGIDVPADLVPLAIDEFPAIFIAAACAAGETTLRGAEELRVKESDRIAVMAEGLSTLGIEVEPRADGIRIVGGPLRGGAVHARGDHRIAMAFAMAGLRAETPITIEGCAEVDTSFPGFVGLARDAGLGIRSEAVQS